MSYQSLKPCENNANLTHPVDARLRHISQTILPSTPYLLTIPPTDFRVGPHHLREWRRGCPFEAHEEALQYLSFWNHQNEDTMYRVLGDWDDGHGNIKPPQDKRSGTNSPLPGQPAKKKISLLDYKNKANGQSAAKASTPKVVEDRPKPIEDPKPSHTPAAEQPDSAQAKPQGVKRFAYFMLGSLVHLSTDLITGLSTLQKTRLGSNRRSFLHAPRQPKKLVKVPRTLKFQRSLLSSRYLRSCPLIYRRTLRTSSSS